jgi:ribonuclease HI
MPDMDKREMVRLVLLPMPLTSIGPTDDATMHVDGASIGSGPAGAGVVIVDCHNKKMAEISHPRRTTNNVAEYQALILGLRKARGSSACGTSGRFELMVKQINGDYRIRDEKLQTLSREAKDN